MTVKRHLVIGLGNPLMGDDGIGPAVIAALQGRDLPAGVELLDAGSPGLALLDIWQGYERVWLVDAVEMEAEPGGCRWLEASDLLRLDVGRVEAHGGIAGTLQLALELEQLPEDFRLLAVQPERVIRRMFLSAAGSRGVQAAATEIRRCWGSS